MKKGRKNQEFFLLRLEFNTVSTINKKRMNEKIGVPIDSEDSVSVVVEIIASNSTSS